MQHHTASTSGTANKYWDRRFGTWALGVAAIDLLSKELATWMLGGREIAMGDRFGLLLVYNTGGVGGYPLGETLSFLNVVMTAMSIGIMTMVAADLGRFHRLGAVALGIVTGGAIGNFASMVAKPEGVADFLVLHLEDRSIIFNVADIALWCGAMLLIPIVVLLMRAIRAQRTNKGALQSAA